MKEKATPGEPLWSICPGPQEQSWGQGLNQSLDSQTLSPYHAAGLHNSASRSRTNLLMSACEPHYLDRLLRTTSHLLFIHGHLNTHRESAGELTVTVKAISRLTQVSVLSCKSLSCSGPTLWLLDKQAPRSILNGLSCSEVPLLLKNLTWYTGIPHFTVTHFIAFHRCCIFFFSFFSQIEGKSLQQQKDYSSL